MIEIINADALETLVGWNGARRFDLVVTDPPFSSGNQGIPENELTANVILALHEAAKLVKPGGWMLVMSASSDRSLSFVRGAVSKVLVPVRIAPWCRVGAKSIAKDAGWNFDTYLVSAFRRKKGRKDKKEQKTESRRIPGYIVAAPLKHGRRFALPSEVADWMIGPFAMPGGTLLDPFAGSFEIVRAAERAGMHGVGIDISR
jgi:DNA modification methylase